MRKDVPLSIQTIFSVREIQAEADRLRSAGKRIGVVPTMGYLHEGHLSLIRRAKELADVVITTIFVNPTQFSVGEDFESYPRDLDADNLRAGEAGADVVFCPDRREMYPEGYLTYVEVETVTSILEGAFRPTHFRGVTTVVAKLFGLTKPHVAVFGQKDAQQAFVVRKMVSDLNMDVEIHVEPTVREPDGLAMSSRNVYLNRAERTAAASLYAALIFAEKQIQDGERSVEKLSGEMKKMISDAGATAIDYIACVEPDTFTPVEAIHPPRILILLAVRFGATRLIDNISVTFS